MHKCAKCTRKVPNAQGRCQVHKEVRRLRTLALETIKTLNDRNLAFMKNLFEKREVSKRNLEVSNQNAT